MIKVAQVSCLYLLDTRKQKKKLQWLVLHLTCNSSIHVCIYICTGRTFYTIEGGKQAGILLMPREKKHITRVNLSLVRQESSLKVSFGCQRFTKILNFGQIHQIIIGNMFITSVTISIMPEKKLSHGETFLTNISFLSRFIFRFIGACSATIEACLDYYH